VTLAAAEGDAELGYVILIDTDADVVWVLRRADGARFQKRFEASAEDSYALALVAAELLEVARSGGDPVALGLTGETDVGEGVESSESAAVEEVTADARPSASPDPAPLDSPPEPAKEQTAFTLGVGAEVWGTFGEEAPWLVEPSLFFDVVTRVGSTLRIGGGVFVSGFGRFDGETADAFVTYSRYDIGARGSLGFDTGPFATRLLVHVRVGGSVVVGDGRTSSLTTQETAHESVEAFFAGLSLEGRQPLVLGLELFLDLYLDVLPAPVAFVAFGGTPVAEGSVRLGGRAGFCWRFR
jgi:hypothetical protein